MPTRNAIVNALLAQVTAGGAFQTSGRRLLHWSKVAAQPACFVRHINEHFEPRGSRMPAKVTLDCEIWIYSNTAGGDSLTAPDVALSALLDTVEAALLPLPYQDRQSLGGLVQHAWIEGSVELYPGDLDNQAIAVVPVRILVPSLQGT